MKRIMPQDSARPATSERGAADLRATPTAAGPSSSKRSVLWRTRGFETLGFECFVGVVSGTYFVRRHVILKVCVCYMLLNYASRNHPSCVGKSVRNGPKIVPKPV